MSKKQLEQLKQIEILEQKYLNKYFHFLKSVEDELLEGFKTKEIIRDDWFGLYKSGISDFAVGAERIVYSLMNGRSIGVPNSCPVGADLFFDVKDAFIHIDLKTVGATLNEIKANKKKGIKAWSNNIGDYASSIFVGTNQNSYKGLMEVTRGADKGKYREYIPNLPTFYNKNKSNQKPCLSYFISILYDKDFLNTLVISIVCMPNGELEPHYTTRALQAGKNLDKTRFRFRNIPDFELLDENKKRIKVISFDKNMNEAYKSKLRFFEQLFIEQSQK
jgi:hypothetical protein